MCVGPCGVCLYVHMCVRTCERMCVYVCVKAVIFNIFITFSVLLEENCLMILWQGSSIVKKMQGDIYYTTLHLSHCLSFVYFEML